MLCGCPVLERVPKRIRVGESEIASVDSSLEMYYMGEQRNGAVGKVVL